MNFHEELYREIMLDMNLAEIPGKDDHPKIELAHQITKIEGEVGGDSTDEIPWCASMMNLWVLIVGARHNPGRVTAMMKRRKLADSTILKVLFYAGHEPRLNHADTGVEIPEPTWSALALSWKDWADPVDPKYAQEGDIWVGGRTGGGHVSSVTKLGSVYDVVSGANQSNKVCTSDSYARTRRITIRRWTPKTAAKAV